jgi:hypothetical protein
MKSNTTKWTQEEAAYDEFLAAAADAEMLFVGSKYTNGN